MIDEQYLRCLGVHYQWTNLHQSVVCIQVLDMMFRISKWSPSFPYSKRAWLQGNAILVHPRPECWPLILECNTLTITPLCIPRRRIHLWCSTSTAYVESLVEMLQRSRRGLYCCAASVASKQHYKQDLRKIYRRGDEFSNWSLFTRLHCATFNQSALRHEDLEDLRTDVTPPSHRPFSRGF